MNDYTTILVTLCVIAAGIMLLVLLGVGFATEAKVARHSGGRVGLIKDNLLLLGPAIVPLSMIAVGSLTSLDDTSAWLWVWGVVLVGVIVWNALPVVRRARQRLNLVHRFPPQ